LRLDIDNESKQAAQPGRMTSDRRERLLSIVDQ
jgi:hypothetical protein